MKDAHATGSGAARHIRLLILRMAGIGLIPNHAEKLTTQKAFTGLSAQLLAAPEGSHLNILLGQFMVDRQGLEPGTDRL